MHAIALRSRVFQERRIFINENGIVAARRSFNESRQGNSFRRFYDFSPPKHSFSIYTHNKLMMTFNG